MVTRLSATYPVLATKQQTVFICTDKTEYVDFEKAREHELDYWLHKNLDDDESEKYELEFEFIIRHRVKLLTILLDNQDLKPKSSEEEK